ncbi:PEP-CTERM sorting domain-containing protein [Luteolibacter pohnpeiensis]|uniref:PEP-CTERM sorting domain-containing protein n=1 Tax=Luteolibacter pohnpeiensis TaxID=454153 RepID=A0A934VWB7_9BACT|nr:PEP-CTERM sorting domain-containing protein [Luteolibacter pohnpeiensis]MBK1884452.1 PEP-CTERM sorting domain-containing protein [Luteolibacter pohnpeiensis]
MRPKSSFAATSKSLLLLGASAATSSGAVVYSEVNGGAGITAQASTDETIYLNVLTSTTSLNVADVSGYQIQITPIGISASAVTNKFEVGHPNGQLLGYTGLSQKLNPGDTVDGSLEFSTANIRTITDGSLGWSLGTTGYMAFTIVSDEETTLYGWMELSWQGDDTDSAITLLSYAYEDTGAGLVIPIPEPTSAALLSGCGAAFAARRRRRGKIAA